MSKTMYPHPVGAEVPRATGITGQLDKPALTYWAAGASCDLMIEKVSAIEGDTIKKDVLFGIIESARKNFRTVSRKALDAGSRIHEAIEVYFKTGKEPVTKDDQVISGFLAFLEWKDAHKVEPIKLEHTVYGYDWAGTLDFYGYFNGKKYVIDWKSSKAIYDEMRYQVAGYRSAVGDCEGCGILRLDKESGFPEWVDTSQTYHEDLCIFNALTDIWWLRNKSKHEQFLQAVGQNREGA
jgi:hypothetical protein